MASIVARIDPSSLSVWSWDSSRAGDTQEDLACGVFGCVSFERTSTFWQSHFVGAVMIRF